MRATDQSRSRPLQSRHDCTTHYLVLVALAQEAQLFGELRDALAVARLGVGIGEVRAPIAALRPVRIEHALDDVHDVTERIGLPRQARRGRYLDADVGIFRERDGLAER